MSLADYEILLLVKAHTSARISTCRPRRNALARRDAGAAAACGPLPPTARAGRAYGLPRRQGRALCRMRPLRLLRALAVLWFGILWYSRRSSSCLHDQRNTSSESVGRTIWTSNSFLVGSHVLVPSFRQRTSANICRLPVQTPIA